ncbi:mRNA-capping enzyme subunit beta [Linnemannia hyalina]|uniref:mRNA-capping enzyme subunit beta n=1 Tax=Linnemannia hyalina TaxID=64524 RepID=A0A9P7XVZ8_9FUNG|nr:mRNA-capping enzyme subunit beta [Linnemannia hyalina]
MSDQGTTKKRPREEEAQETAAPSSNGAGATSTSGQEGRDGSSSKRPRPEESSSSSSLLADGTPSAAPPHPEQQQRPRPPRPALFFGSNIPDDVVQAVADFLYDRCHGENVEIEAKVGILIDKTTQQRIQMPVQNEVVLAETSSRWYTFSSDMTVAQHAHFNRCLNKSGEMSQHSESKVAYKHTYETDQFFTVQGKKTRVSRDQKTNAVIGSIQKRRIADLDIFSPRRPFDYRISVNVEEPVDLPSGNPERERKKDRVSYQLNNLKIDLTQVKSNNMPNNPAQPPSYSQMRPTVQQTQLDLTHELEIEFVNAAELAREREIRINSQGRQPDRFLEITANFINNIRGLIAQGQNIQHHPPQHMQQRSQQHQHQQNYPNQQRR